MTARTIQLALRVTDTFGRWGGEEFLAILYDVPNLGSLESPADKIRALTEFSRLDVNGQGLAVTLSIGGTLLQPGDTAESLLKRADELMYHSKQAGRNHVTIG
jgi:diguanylate cyclase (GGDEF)-like protein